MVWNYISIYLKLFLAYAFPIIWPSINCLPHLFINQAKYSLWRRFSMPWPQNTTYSPAHSISKQGSRYGPLVCPSKPSSGGMQRICSWHPDMRHSREKESSQRNHHIERGRRRRRSSRIGHQMRYREPKQLVFRGVYFKDVLETCAHLQAECSIKHARYCLIIMITQKYVKRMPICFARDRVCAISIARIDQMRYRELKKLVFSGV